MFGRKTKAKKPECKDDIPGGPAEISAPEHDVTIDEHPEWGKIIYQGPLPLKRHTQWLGPPGTATPGDLHLFLELLDHLHAKCITGDLTPNDAIWGTVRHLHNKYAK